MSNETTPHEEQRARTDECAKNLLDLADDHVDEFAQVCKAAAAQLDELQRELDRTRETTLSLLTVAVNKVTDPPKPTNDPKRPTIWDEHASLSWEFATCETCGEMTDHTTTGLLVEGSRSDCSCPENTTD